MYLNKAYLIGNLTRDPELKALPSGTKVASFGLATNYTFRDKDGNRKDQTDFHNIVVFSKLAELTAQYLKKGSQALVEGRIQTRSWDDATTGTKKYKTEIVAENIQFGAKGSAASAKPTDNVKETKDLPAGDTIEYPQDDINPDDIPF